MGNSPNFARLHDVMTVIRNSEIPPTMREIMEATDITSTSVANYYLNILEKLGLIERRRGKARGIILIRKDSPAE